MNVQNAARVLSAESSPLAYGIIFSHWSKRLLHEFHSTVEGSNGSIGGNVAILVAKYVTMIKIVQQVNHSVTKTIVLQLRILVCITIPQVRMVLPGLNY